MALLVVAAINILTFAPPWQVALPGLSFVRAPGHPGVDGADRLPAGLAAGMAGSFAMLRGRVSACSVTRAVTLTGLWNQFLNLSFQSSPSSSSRSPAATALLGVAAFVGAGVLGVVVAAFVVALISNGLAGDVGAVAAHNWSLGKVGRGPVSWGAASFERFRDDAGDLVRRRWHLLTLTSLLEPLRLRRAAVSLRAVDVPASEVTAVEAFAAWALVRILATVPITPGGRGRAGLTAALVSFGGTMRVVAAVLVYRFLTVVPTLLLGLIQPARGGAGQPP